MSFVLLGILNSQATGGVVPAPDFLTSAPLWLDAADATTITESGGSVSQWNNKGTFSNLTQATAADQPTTNTETINGKNVLDFRTNKKMTFTNKDEWKILHDGTVYFFAFAMQQTTGGENIVFSNIVATSAENGPSFTINQDEFNFQVYRGVQGSPAAVVVDDGFITEGSPIIVSSLVSLNATASERVEYFQNETQGLVNNSLSNSPTTANPTNDLQVIPDALIAEGIIVSGADATEANRQLVVDYLNSKWGAF